MKKKVEVSTTVQRAIKIINFLNDSTGPQSLTNISKELELSITIVHRLLTTLRLEGFVFQDKETKRYTLGVIFLNYANKIIAQMPISTLIEPYLIELRDSTKETIGFYVPNGDQRLCVLELESTLEIKRTVGVGTKLPIYAGATGRAIVAFQSEKLREHIINSITNEDIDLYREKVNETVRNGYALSVSEISENVTALSAPVFEHNKKVIGAISISGPSFRFNKHKIEKYIAQLLKVTKEISNSLY